MLNKIKVISLLSGLLLIYAATEIKPQSLNDLRRFETERTQINSNGMLILGGWAALNIIGGTVGYYTAKDQSRYFYQFNALWNTVNMAIAVFGYLQAANSDPNTMTSADIIGGYNDLQSFLLLNAGLDLAYIMTGFFLLEKGKTSTKYSDRLKGYGYSLFVQGGFLFAFDLIMYFVHKNNAQVMLYPIIDRSFSDNIGVGLNMRFDHIFLN